MKIYETKLSSNIVKVQNRVQNKSLRICFILSNVYKRNNKLRIIPLSKVCKNQFTNVIRSISSTIFSRIKFPPPLKYKFTRFWI